MQEGQRRRGKGADRRIITIDGPAGAGKSTVSKMLAGRLQFLYLDTGAMYRAVAVCASKEGIDLKDQASLERWCRKVRLFFRIEGTEQRVICQGEDVTEKIREPQVGWMASTVSTQGPVREAMAKLQRRIGKGGRIVAEGRDTGTVVYPEAEFKFFLSAASGERARRRSAELAAKGMAVRVEEVEKEIRERDNQDSQRELAPLRPAEDACIIDSTGLTPEEVVDKMLSVIQGGRSGGGCNPDKKV